jgi:hypothetical protein
MRKGILRKGRMRRNRGRVEEAEQEGKWKVERGGSRPNDGLKTRMAR